MDEPQVRGMTFPFGIDPATGKVEMTGGQEKLRQNVRLILGTRLGERPMLREFGTRIPSLVHEVNDDVLADLIRSHARDALMRFEPRILVTAADVEQKEHELSMRIEFAEVQRRLPDVVVVPLTS